MGKPGKGNQLCGEDKTFSGELHIIGKRVMCSYIFLNMHNVIMQSHFCEIIVAVKLLFTVITLDIVSI